MKSFVVAVAVLVSAPALAQNPWDLGKKVAGDAATGQLEKEINKRLLAEGRKNQCSFKSNSDQIAGNCNAKLKNLANALISAKKKLNDAGIKNFKFEVSGHTDSSGSAQLNKELSAKRAATIVKEMKARGVAESEIISVGRGSEQMLVKPDNTPAKKAQNRRYELQVRL